MEKIDAGDRHQGKLILNTIPFKQIERNWYDPVSRVQGKWDHNGIIFSNSESKHKHMLMQPLDSFTLIPTLILSKIEYYDPNDKWCWLFRSFPWRWFLPKDKTIQVGYTFPNDGKKIAIDRCSILCCRDNLST
jgi:hypothetical protein